MSATHSADKPGIPADLTAAADDVNGYLQIAQAIEGKRFAEVAAPAGLLPALVVALAVSHAAKVGAAEVVAAVESLESCMERSLDTLETCLATSGGETKEILEKLESTLNDLPDRIGVDSVLIERLAGIENELYRIAGYIGGKVAKS